MNPRVPFPSALCRLLAGILAILASPPMNGAESPDVPAARSKDYSWMSRGQWREFHADDLERASAGPVGVLFLGDSITECWDGKGAEVWKEYFAPFAAANFGVGGDTTQNVLWRITKGGALDKVRPKVVVILIGTNNIGLLNDKPESVVRGIGAIVRTVRSELPEAGVILLDIFPRGVPGDSYRRAVEETNRLLSVISTDDPMVRHVRIWDEFMDRKGNLPASLMPDKLHLTEKGYRIWAETMSPTLREMLSAPAEVVAKPKKRTFRDLFRRR